MTIERGKRVVGLERDTVREEVARAYLSGARVVDLASDLGRSRDFVYQLLHEHPDVAIVRPAPLPSAEVLWARYVAGETLDELAVDLGATYGRVHRRLAAAGYVLRQRGPRRRNRTTT